MKRINIGLKIKIRLRLINLILNNNMINLIKLNIKILLKENKRKLKEWKHKEIVG
jgi:hypothetical protein